MDIVADSHIPVSYMDDIRDGVQLHYKAYEDESVMMPVCPKRCLFDNWPIAMQEHKQATGPYAT